MAAAKTSRIAALVRLACAATGREGATCELGRAAAAAAATVADTDWVSQDAKNAKVRAGPAAMPLRDAR